MSRYTAYDAVIIDRNADGRAYVDMTVWAEPSPHPVIICSEDEHGCSTLELTIAEAAKVRDALDEAIAEAKRYQT